MNPSTLIRAIEQAKIALCQNIMTPEQVRAFHELADLKDRLLDMRVTCQATVVRNVEDTGYLCGKRCAEGSYLCAEHQELEN